MSINIGHHIIELGIIDSTNNYATKEILTKRPPEGTVYIANEQKSGRGQINNSWESERGKNLTLSIVIYPSYVDILQQFEISKVFALGIADFFSEFVDDVSIKWPNDIYVGKNKIGGLLIENSICNGQIASSIAGMGLNINQQKFVSDAPNPVSLTQITGEEYDLDYCLRLLCEKIDLRYNQLLSGATDIIDNDYVSKMFRLNEWARYVEDEIEYIGRIDGVDKIGRLLITDREGEQKHYHFKEVMFVI
jgi:BirA family biotin operon repressor/biotin-[acetyl-CoA-carboxylase] ligase